MLRYLFLSLFLIVNLFAQSSSNALYITKNQEFIYTANLDAGSVTKTSLKDGVVINEKVLGKDLRRIAFNKNESQYAVTDHGKNVVYIINTKDNSLEKTIKTPSQPHAIVYDEKKNNYYVTAFEANKIISIDAKKLEINQEINTLETPRGLALTNDNRLLVSHALIGKVSIFKLIENEKAIDSKPITIISLHETQNEKESVSQGLPRYLDDIEITPDGKEAWLPHLLWNVDHAFQFQSTIFPTISIIDLTPYNEKELEIKRKHLFKEINIQDKLNKTLIISNPWDLVFSPSGHKAFITLAGSEDLLVMDIKRSTQNKRRKSRQHRIRKKRAGSGARAVQIYRHLPGANPRAIVISENGEDLYVQNAMSLDLTKLNTGGKGTFSRVTIEKDIFAKLVKNDPLSKELREGKTVFNLGNSDKYKNNPIVGDFWMSCASCHYEGFNSTNRFMLKDFKVDKYKDAVAGHRNLDSFFSKNFISDYTKIIKQTQGGFGEDGIMEEKVDGQKPNKEVKQMLTSLHKYVQAPENLPLMSTWLKLDDDKKTAHKSQWLNSASCKQCHPTIYKQWANSSHGTAMDHPYYEFQENIAAKKEGEEFRAFCRGCHMPQLLLTGRDSSEYKFKNNMFEKDAMSLQKALKEGESVIEAGTGCFFCHRVNKARNAGGNADLSINLKDRDKYFFENTSNETLKWANEKSINANPKAHKDSYTNKDLYQDSLYCGTCHNEFIPGTGVKINDNYGEWLASSFNNPKDKTKHRSCIDCHMKADISSIGKDVEGFSTLGGKLKKDVKTHHFTGANDYLAGLRSDEHRKLSIDLLRIATKLEANINDDKLTIRVNNIQAGHKFPGGARRQIWLEITVKDKFGSVVYKNGHMQGNSVPKGAREFKKVAGDKDGVPVGLHFWRYEKMIKDTRIPADGYRDEVFDIPSDITYPLQVETRLLFRAFSPKLTDKVRDAFPKRDIPYAQVVEINKLVKKFEN
ncbi:multiheme c-type cytochrome [Poseidonibacter lekithochrous]|uniref:multiheme c-type cytochrome n=1 Tax=Poseidonibacter lekithochrous TaxID=1904463 RepID=UPI0008FC6DB6|nr:multiheme c-type cytochrome [Poseidonibacter lekithochrous]QKJ23243.1 cytochrome c554 (YncE domain) [Poseidonibacter lekithochrous]